jgi:lipopolysaccharide biosynthesis protein
MTFDYKELEEQLAIACNEVHQDFLKRFNSDVYISAGGARLEIFINDLQKEFESTAAAFLKKYDLEKDTEAKKKVLTITKLYAKKCIDDFSKI